MFGQTKLTPEQKAAKQARKELERVERARQNAIINARNEQRKQERFDAFPEFVVRETREVLVKAANHTDAIALAGAAFKEGQQDDHRIKRGGPWGVEGNTVGPIEVLNIKAGKVDFG